MKNPSFEGAQFGEKSNQPSQQEMRIMKLILSKKDLPENITQSDINLLNKYIDSPDSLNEKEVMRKDYVIREFAQKKLETQGENLKEKIGKYVSAISEKHTFYKDNLAILENDPEDLSSDEKKLYYTILEYKNYKASHKNKLTNIGDAELAERLMKQVKAYASRQKAYNYERRDILEEIQDKQIEKVLERTGMDEDTFFAKPWKERQELLLQGAEGQAYAAEKQKALEELDSFEIPYESVVFFENILELTDEGRSSVLELFAQNFSDNHTAERYLKYSPIYAQFEVLDEDIKESSVEKERLLRKLNTDPSLNEGYLRKKIQTLEKEIETSESLSQLERRAKNRSLKRLKNDLRIVNANRDDVKAQAETKSTHIANLKDERQKLRKLEGKGYIRDEESCEAVAKESYDTIFEYHTQFRTNRFIQLESFKRTVLLMIDNMSKGLSIYLEGETGVGKTKGAQAAARVMTGLEAMVHAMNVDTMAQDLDIEKTAVANDAQTATIVKEVFGILGKSFFGILEPGQDPEEVARGLIAILDEANYINPSALNAVLKKFFGAQPGDEIDGNIVLPGAGIILTGNMVNERYGDRQEFDASILRELFKIYVDYWDNSVENPEGYKALLAVLMDEDGNIGIPKEELAPAYNYKAYDEPIIDEKTQDKILGESEIVKDLTSIEHGTAYRLSFAIKDLQNAFSFAKSIRDKEELNPENTNKMLWYTSGKPPKIGHSGQEKLAIDTPITPQDVLPWMDEFSDRFNKNDSRYHTKTFSDYLKVCIEDYIRSKAVNDDDAIKIRAVFNYYNLLDTNQNYTGDTSPPSKVEIGAMPSDVPRPLKIEYHEAEKVDVKESISPELLSTLKEGVITATDFEGNTYKVYKSIKDSFKDQKSDKEFNILADNDDQKGTKLYMIDEEGNGRSYLFAGVDFSKPFDYDSLSEAEKEQLTFFGKYGMDKDNPASEDSLYAKFRYKEVRDGVIRNEIKELKDKFTKQWKDVSKMYLKYMENKCVKYLKDIGQENHLADVEKSLNS